MSVETIISGKLSAISQQLSDDPKLLCVFQKCFINTIQTTVTLDPEEGTYIITGDIDALWLRDSSQQVYHYIRFAKEEPEIAAMIEGLIKRQVRCVLLDPYANAFNQTANDRHYLRDKPLQHPAVWERKYEIDSLCHMVWLCAGYYHATHSKAFMTEQFYSALETIVDLWYREQHHASQSDYYFIRTDGMAHDTLSCNGKGSPTAYTGMTWSGFRPSDDSCRYGYLIPSNLFACESLKSIAEFAGIGNRMLLAQRATGLRDDILRGIAQFGTINHPEFGLIYAYEADGLGNQLFMDDANIPSLLSLPYLGVCSVHDPMYLRTRQACLSHTNPFYYSGKHAGGIGSPHTPKNHIWPISLCVQGLTTQCDDEAALMLETLLQTDAGTSLMHESFHADDPFIYSRPWFAWANSMFGEFVYSLFEQNRLRTVMHKASLLREAKKSL